MSADAKQCPWCGTWALKDSACNYIFACGLETSGKFVVGSGCGRSWCWLCAKKFCGIYIDPNTGIKSPRAIEVHSDCCQFEPGFKKDDYCCGGHNSHCNKRWD